MKSKLVTSSERGGSQKATLMRRDPIDLRVLVDSCSPANLSALTTILIGGTPIACANRMPWLQAVQDHFDNVPLFVTDGQQLQLVYAAATQMGYEVHQAADEGYPHVCDLEVLLQGNAPFPTSAKNVRRAPRLLLSHNR